MDRLSNDAINQILKVDVKILNQDYMNMLTFLPKHSPYQDFFRKRFTFCLKCLCEGYHSILNQFTLIHDCPIHKENLLERCPKCNHSRAYRLNDETFIDPFHCSCGYNYFKSGSNYSQTWKQHRPQITLNEVKIWAELYNSRNNSFDKLILSSQVPFRNLPGGIDFILQASDINYSSSRSEIHYVSKSTSKIMLYGNHFNEFDSIRASVNDERYFKFNERINKEIYLSNRSTFYAIVKNLKNTILRDHLPCIKQFGNLDKKCPYSFAYTNWRKFIEGHSNWWQIDNRQSQPKQQLQYEMEFISKQDDSALWDIVRKLEYGRPNWKYTHLSATKWIINKVLAHFILNHFYSWLEISKDQESLMTEYHVVPFKYESVPFFLFKLPSNNGEQLEFHWWINDQHQQKILDINLKCPFLS